MTTIQTKNQGKIFLVPQGNHIRIISPKSINYIQADGNYSVFVLVDKNEYTLCHTLEFVQKVLESAHFVRCHKSYLINLSKIHEINRRKLRITMENKVEVPISRRKRKELFKALLERGNNTAESVEPTVHSEIPTEY